jgi:hypothetical protein
MKKSKNLMLLVGALLVITEFTACVVPSPSPVVRGRRRGAVAGAAVGGAVGGWEGAAAGAMIGGAAGGMAGRTRRAYYTGTPYYAPARSIYGMGYY